MENIEDIRETVRELGLKIDAPTKYVVLASQALGDGSYHLEIVGNEYNFILTERGTELDRKVTTSIEDLLFWIFSEVTMKMAMAFEKTNRDTDRDHRRMIFERKLFLLEKLNRDWAMEEKKSIEKILKKNPFDDELGKRVELCKKLINAGYIAEEAYEGACKKYPLPEAIGNQ